MNKINILTGPVDSGKTSRLLEFSKGNPLIGGFCSPKKFGKRWLYFLSTGLELSMEDFENESETISVGRFIFSKSVFPFAIKQFEIDLTKENLKLLIVDELGLLELRREGFFSLMEILKMPHTKKEFLVVIRSSLLDDFQKVFSLMPCQTQLWTTENIDKLFLKLFENE